MARKTSDNSKVPSNDKASNKIKAKGKNKDNSFLKELWKNKFLYALLVPGIIWFVVFAYVPLVGLIMAFQDFNFVKGIFGSKLIGFKNFEFLFNSKNLWVITWNTVYLNVLFIITGTTVAVFLALIFVEINNKWFKRITQSISILPHFMSWTVVAMFMTAFISTDTGIINKMLMSVGLNQIAFYSDPSVWPVSLVLLKIWQGAGFGTIIYIATIIGFDKEMYEAAQIDGASRLQQVSLLTLPMLRPTIIMLTIFSVGGIFKGDFGMIYAIIGDNPLLYPTTDVIDTFVYRSLRTLGDMGMSTAVGLYQSFIGFLMVLIVNKIAKAVEPDSAIF